MSFILFLLVPFIVKGNKYPDGPSAETDPAIKNWDHWLPYSMIVSFWCGTGYIFLYGIYQYIIRQNRKQEFEFKDKNIVLELADTTKQESRDVKSTQLGGENIPEDNQQVQRASLIKAGRRNSIQMKFGDEAMILDPQEGLMITAYKNSIQGFIGLFFYGWILFELALLFFLIIIDYYWDCQTGGIDNQCYYGSYPLTGWSNNDWEIFSKGKTPQTARVASYDLVFLYWILSFIILSVSVCFQDSIRNFFREPSTFQDADVMYIFEYDEESFLTPNPTFFVLLGRQLGEFMRTSLAMGDPGHGTTCPIKSLIGSSGQVRFVEYQFVRYIVKQEQLFRVALDMDYKISSILAEGDGGLSSSVVRSRLQTMGKNEIPYRTDTMTELFMEEFLNRFFLYQWMIYIVWFYWSYLFTAAVEFSVVLVCSFWNMYLKWVNQSTIAKITAFESEEEVKRNGEWIKVDGKDIVPGDIIRISSDWKVPADIVLLKGSAVCNESGLTGESMPVSKIAGKPDSDAEFGTKGANKFTLFAGTKVLQAGSNADELVYGKVMSTGISTSRGDLISTILKPTKLVFQYDEEYRVCFLMLLAYGIFLFSLVIIIKKANGSNSHWVLQWMTGVFSISQMLSPLMPLTLIVGQAASSERLASANDIFCVNPKRIGICGKVRVCCFDKTGTITNEGLDFTGVVTAEDGQLSDLMDSEKSPDIVLNGLATCHAVTQLGTEFVGNQVEVKMLSSTGWTLQEGDGSVAVVSPDGNRTIEISKRYEFDHHLMRMSVVVKEGDQFRAYCKGAYETIAKMCDPATLPEDFLQVSENYAKDGCYVLGLCTKKLPMQSYETIKRDEIEVEGTFECLGLILFRNELKSESRQAMMELREGDVRTVMITGDNAACGYYIARQSAMIQEDVEFYLAKAVDVDANPTVRWFRLDTKDEVFVHEITDEMISNKNVELGILGPAYELLKNSGEMDRLLLKTRVYARFSPGQKKAIVESLIARGLIVAMCGDGGNDCGALRASHAGLALSDAEASVVSPFTSKNKQITAMVDLLREGRCALATSFATWKFIITFGQTYVFAKYAAVYYDTIMTSMAYLVMDVIVVVPITIALTFALPLDKLGKERPSSSLLGPSTVFWIVGVAFFNLMFGIIAWCILPTDDNYIKWPLKCYDGAAWYLAGDSWEACLSFTSFSFQMTALALFAGLGTRFRKPIWTNWKLCVCIVFYFISFSVLLLGDENEITSWFHFPQENHNRYRTPSNTWNFYQNVGKKGLPAFLSDDCAIVTMDEPTYSTFWQNLNEIHPSENYTEIYDPSRHDTTWSSLYASYGDESSQEFSPSLVSEAEYRPGSSELYDQCSYDVCQQTGNKPDCPCGRKDGIFQPLDSNLAMPFSLRFKIYIIFLCNNLVAFLWVTQVMEGFGRNYIYSQNQEKIASTKVPLDL